MVQDDNGGNQDFVYLEFQTNSKTVTITFKNCKDLQVTKTAIPTFDRAFTWTIAKSVVGPDTKTANAGTSVGFDYNVVVTKSAPVDSNWKVTGTISVTNPNAFTVSRAPSPTRHPARRPTVRDRRTTEPVGPLQRERPRGPDLHLLVRVQAVLRHAHQPRDRDVARRRAATRDSSASADAPFQFGTGSAGNPSTTHDSITSTTPSTAAARDAARHTRPRDDHVHGAQGHHRPERASPAASTSTTPRRSPPRTRTTPRRNSSSVTTHVCVTGHDLTIEKTVNPSYTRTYTWTIDKKVNGEDSDGPISSDQPTVPAHYTVVTTKTGANHGFKLAGTITVTNPNSFAVSGATVTDQAPSRLHLHRAGWRRRRPAGRGRVGERSTTPAPGTARPIRPPARTTRR